MGLTIISNSNLIQESKEKNLLMESIAKLSSKYQIVIPKKIRRELKLKVGDELIMKVENDKIIMRTKPKNYTEYMLGLGEKIWKE